MKPVLFALIAGAAGAAAGGGMFLLSGAVTEEFALRAATGGLGAVAVPLVLFLVFHKKLLAGGPGNQ